MAGQRLAQAAIEHQHTEQHQTGDKVIPPGGKAEQHQYGVNLGEEKGAEKRAKQRAGTAKQRDPAQYAGGDGFHLQAAAGLIRHKTNLRGEDDPGAGRQHTVEGKGQHPRAVDRHAQLRAAARLSPTA